jgi:pantetheine-phosphate adenylyltransferase
MNKKIAIYPGSFDPITNGHLDILERAVKLFDVVIISVIHHPGKKNALLTLEERMDLIRAKIKPYGKKVQLAHFDGLLVDFAKKMKAGAIVRGLRALSDFEYEFSMALTNRKLMPQIETIFLMTDYKYSYLSSTNVKSVAKFGGDLNGLVPTIVEKKLKEKLFQKPDKKKPKTR